MLSTKVIKEERTPIVDACKEDDFAQIEDSRGRLVVDGLPECDHTTVEGFCEAYLNPERKWAGKVCPLSPLVPARALARSAEDQQKVNPIKMSKRNIKQ